MSRVRGAPACGQRCRRQLRVRSDPGRI